MIANVTGTSREVHAAKSSGASLKDTADALSFFASDAGSWRFFALLFPGFIALAVYDLRVPGERRKWGDMGIALVAYSIAIDVFATAYLKIFPIPATETAAAVFFAIIADLVVPALVGWFVVDIRGKLALNGLILSAVPKAWDEFFSRIKGEQVALVLTLADGRKIGGFWAENPFASSYPSGEDLLITVPVLVDPETGRFVQRVADAKGLLVKRDDIVTIEAFDAEAMAREAIASPATSAESPKE
jgi:hypothetical protein